MNLYIDYMTFTVNMDGWTEPDQPLGWRNALPPLIDEMLHWQQTEFERGIPDRFYEYQVTCQITGARIDAARGKQGVRVQLPGQWWEGVREDQLQIMGLLVHQFSRNVTRLDIAYDFTSAECGAAAVAAEYWLQHGVEGHRRTKLIPYKKGSTFYIGSRNSNKMLRVYDKGKQLGADENWRRCELEIKGRTAQANAALLARGLRPAVKIMKEVLACPESFLDGILDELLDGEIPNPIKVPRKETNRFAWLCDQVIPAWKNMAKTNPDDSKRALDLLIAELLEVMVEYEDKQD